jgi:penicillin G amidase
LDAPDDSLWDRKGTPEVETRDDILTMSLTAAVADLRQALGDDMNGWTWGKMHVINPPHPFGGQPVIGGMFSLPVLPLGGDGSTVAVATFTRAAPLQFIPFPAVNHQSYRMIVDLGDFEQSLGMFSTGQSGQPFSKHWGDLLQPWQRMEYNPILFSIQEIDLQKEGVLTLVP